MNIYSIFEELKVLVRKSPISISLNKRNDILLKISELFGCCNILCDSVIIFHGIPVEYSSKIKKNEIIINFKDCTEKITCI
jgi:hypothetical protein